MNAFARRLILSLVLIAVAIATLVFAISSDNPSFSSNENLSQMMTVDPTVLMNLTRIPQATPLSDEDAAPYITLRKKIEACQGYDDQRREQSLQHVAWLIDPSDMPSDVILALNSDIKGGLIFGIAGFTSTQWRLLERPPDSCLIDIGRDLNVMLEAFDREPIGVYDE